MTNGYAVSLTVGVDTTTTPTAGSAPAGGPAAGRVARRRAAELPTYLML